MSIIKYLNHRQKFFASVLPSIFPCAQISSEVRVKVGRGIVVPTETEAEAVAVEGGGRYGVATVGSAPHFVENFNARLSPSVSRGKATSSARTLCERDGGLSGVEALTLPRGDGGDDNDWCGGGGDGYEVTCNLLRPGEGEGSSSAKDVSERLREWIEEEEEEEERRRRGSAEDGARSRDESSLSSSPRRYVEEAYRVGTTARQCLEVLSSIGDDESSSTMDDHDDEVRERFRSYLEGN